MKSLPHRYQASANGGPSGTIPVRSPGLEQLETDAPAEFGGSGEYWSPETLLVAAVANCFILTFRALSRRAGAEWEDLWVDAEGDLDKTQYGLRFTHFRLEVRLRPADDTDPAELHELLEKAERQCLITNSLTAESEIRIAIES